MAKAVFFCGLACSGKSTLARYLEDQLPAIRYSADEYMRGRHDLTIFDEEYGALAREARKHLWNQGLEELRSGSHVLFDWSLWSRKRRTEWSELAESAGHSYMIIFLDIPLATLRSRLDERNSNLPTAAQHIPISELDRFAVVFERPDAGEGLNFLRVTSSDNFDSVVKEIGGSA